MIRSLPTSVAPGPGDPALLDHPGAFEWWYADLVDDAGNGAVLVASFGLPMIPVALPARRATPPRALPALALGVYAAGRPAHWVFRTFAEPEARWSGDTRTFGDHAVTLRVGADTVALEARLDGRSGGAAFSGTLTAEGPVRRAAGDPAVADHAWSLLSATATGALDLRVEDRHLTVRGSAYVDRNAGVAPLSDLGVTRWSWGRVSFRDGTLVWYETPEAHRGWWVRPDGHVEPQAGPPRPVGSRVGRYLLRHPAAFDVDGPRGPVRVALDTPVEDGPFYRRFLLRVDDPRLGVGIGYAEWAEQRAMDRSPLLPLVRMAVDAGPASSVWMPLLSGPPATRWRRFLAGGAP